MTSSSKIEAFVKKWQETNGGCDESSGYFWHNEGYQAATSHLMPAIKEAIEKAYHEGFSDSRARFDYPDNDLTMWDDSNEAWKDSKSKASLATLNAIIKE